ncbi:threonyl-tRNA synthetase [Pyrenophora teres f. maculata]|nr:threonyl-tRNA synthetase [Pyrenophora teres f. maculata]
MPPLRQLSVALQTLRRRPIETSGARKYARVFVRSCSCNAQLNTTTAAPPAPPTDHRTLAQTHNLFITSPYSPGSPLILPNGAYVFQKLQSFLRAQYPQFGFQEVITPIIYKKSLWEKSGHWENYAEDMFSVQGRGTTAQIPEAEGGEDGEFGLKPMNCPGHCLLFRDEIKSYRDLPVRLADFSALHRNEISGALTGLTRVRRFHQDDAHIFCRPDQILAEIEQTLKFVAMVYRTFGLGPYKLLLSTRPKDSFIGTVEEWDRAEEQLTTALNNIGSEWAINEGDGAFYGPKIDIILKDSNGKEHQTATIQLDFQLPQRFDLQYQASPEELEAGSQTSMDAGLDPTLRRPVIVHRAIYGSIERFMALLIEHYAGKYPFWLSPRPAIILSLNDNAEVLEHVSRVQSVLSGLRAADPPEQVSTSLPKPLPLSTIQLPVDVDTSSRPLAKKIAEARTKKYNHIIVVGLNEVQTGSVNMQVVNQPSPEATFLELQETRGKEVTEKEQRKGANMSHMYNTPIPITVGPPHAQKTFHIYRGLLCHHSLYFDRLLNGPFAESGSSALCLRHVNKATFQVFYDWINTGVVDCTIAAHTDAADAAAAPCPLLILSAYTFALYHATPTFLNALLDTFYTHTIQTRRLHASLIPYLYKYTVEGDAMRRLFVDLWVESTGAEGVGKKTLEGLEREFVVDWVVGCRERGVVLGVGGEGEGVGAG